MWVLFKCTSQHFSFLCWPWAVCYECLLTRMQRFHQVLTWASFTKSRILKIASCTQSEIKSCLTEADEKLLVISFSPAFQKIFSSAKTVLVLFFQMLNWHNSLVTKQILLSIQTFDSTTYLSTYWGLCFFENQTRTGHYSLQHGHFIHPVPGQPGLACRCWSRWNWSGTLASPID